MTTLLLLQAVHWLADFVLQTDWQAKNKSKNWWALTKHVGVYSLCFAFLGWQFTAITFVTHFVTDAITSRINTRLWAAGNVHWFFVSVGFDQLIHTCTLAATWYYLFG
jgi:hypothetical protein